MSSSLDRLLFIIATAGLISVMLLTASLADEASSASSTSSDTAVSEADSQCAAQLIDQGSTLITTYENFLTEFFKVDTPTSSQVEDAMDFYRYVEDSLLNIYAKAGSIPANAAWESSNQGFAYCAHVRDQYIEYARVLLGKYSSLSANSKRSYMFLDGLKAMNFSMENYSDEFHSTFPGIFNKMDNALPCYARQCVTK